MVGEDEEEMKTRVEVPVENLNHQLFRLLLLDNADDEYDVQEEHKFSYTGLFQICCDLDLFLYVNKIIDVNVRV